jgi:hypothetical protein
MTQITVVTDESGKIVAMGHGHLSEATARQSGSSEAQGGLRAGPNQRLHELELSEDLRSVNDWSALHDKVRPHVP